MTVFFAMTVEAKELERKRHERETGCGHCGLQDDSHQWYCVVRIDQEAERYKEKFGSGAIEELERRALYWSIAWGDVFCDEAQSCRLIVDIIKGEYDGIDESCGVAGQVD